MKSIARPFLVLLLATVACFRATAAPALPNPFGVFNLRPMNGMPAQEGVDLAQRAGYDGG